MSRRLLGFAFSAIGGALLCVLGACGGGARTQAEAVPTAEGSGGTTGSFGGAVGEGDGGRKGDRDGDATTRRTVLQRSPFGDITPGNLIMNGDFELGIGAVVPGWYAVADDHVMSFRYRTGGVCHSGLLCAEIAAGQSLVATMVSLPPAGPVTIMAFAKPRSGRLGDVTIRLTLQSLAGSSLASVVLAPANAPESTGFARYQASFEVDRPYDLVSVVVEARDSILLDDVSVRAGAPESKRPFSWPDTRDLPASIDRVTRVAREEARSRRHTPSPYPSSFGRPGTQPVAPRVALPD